MNKKDMLIKERIQQDKKISDKADKIFNNFKEGFRLENKEKKVIKISLNKFIGIAVTTVIVLFVGFNLLAYKMEKPNLISTIEALIKKDDEEILNKTAKELFEKAMISIRDSYKYYESSEEDAEEIQGRYYRKTNSKYEEVEEKYREIFTDEVLPNVINLNFCNKDGVLYALEKAGGTPWKIIELKVEKINEENGELTYKAIYKLSYTDDPDNKQPEEQVCQFKMREENGVYKISATNYLNLDKEEGLDNSKDLDSEEAKKIIQGYLNIFGAKHGSPASALMTGEIGLISSYSEIGNNVNNNYLKSSVKYDDFKNKMLEYMTEELFGKISDSDYKNVNGMLYIADIGASGISFKIEEIELILEEDDKCKYRIKGLEFEPGQEADFIGEVELQKNKENKYVVSKFEWELEENEKSEANDYNNTNSSDNSNNNVNQNLGWKAIDLNEKIVAKSYENKYVTIEFDKDVFNYLREDEKKYNIKTGVEYKLVGYEGEVKELRRINGRGAWPIIILVNDGGQLYLGKTETMEYDNNNYTAKLERCSIGNVKSISEQTEEYCLKITLKSELQYTITLTTLTDEELITKVKKYSEDNFNNFEIVNINSLVRTPETWYEDGQRISESFKIMFTKGEQTGIIKGNIFMGTGDLTSVNLNKI